LIYREIWPHREEWLDFVKRTWVDGGRVQQVKNQIDECLDFKNKAKSSYDSLGIDYKEIKTWVSVQVPKNGKGYDVGYPHIHYPLHGLTLVHYLDPGDKPAQLHIIKNDEVVEEIYPEKGLTVFMPNCLWHGVLKNNGTRDRVQMIATAI